VSEIKETKVSGKGVIIALGIICIVLASGLVATVALNSQIASLNSQITSLKNQITELQTQTNDNLRNATDFILYYEEFGNASLLSPSYTFIPPISMYRALIIALKSGGWTPTSLSGMTVRASLEYWEFWSNSSSSGSELLHYVTQPANDYLPVQINRTTYRYIWDIVIDNNAYLDTLHTPPLGLYWIDAATGELIPHPPLY
jgi:hypothetical protein